jgi:hypothetical protein
VNMEGEKHSYSGQILLTVTDKRQTPTFRQRGRSTETGQKHSDRINF